jgi:hypothetical protein
MNELEARAALRAQGIRTPSRQLVEDYMRVQQAEEWPLEVPEPSSQEPQRQQQTQQEAHSPNPAEPNHRPHPSSESNLAPLLRDRGELVRDRGPRRAGRPRVQAPWFQAVATAMSDGTPLRQALAAVGIQGLTAAQIRALYRNSVLKAMRREARQKWLREWGVRPRDRRRYACKGGERLGMSPQMLRTL